MAYICEKCGKEFDMEMDRSFFDDLFQGNPTYEELDACLCEICAKDEAIDHMTEATSGQWSID